MRGTRIEGWAEWIDAVVDTGDRSVGDESSRGWAVLPCLFDEPRRLIHP